MPLFIDNYNVILLDQLRDLLSISKNAYFALAFIRRSGVDLLSKDFEKLVKNGGTLKMLFGSDFGATDSSAIKALQEVGIDLRFFSGESSFHPKAYLFDTPNGFHAIIGSSNLSASGLTLGTEWSVLLDSEDFDYMHLYSEFRRLWHSSYSKRITSQILELLRKQDHAQAIRESIRREDQSSRQIPVVKKEELLNANKNYIVHRQSDTKPSWNFQVYSNKIQGYAQKDDFNIVVICDYQTANEVWFVIPYAYLRDNILPKAHSDLKGRYLFEVHKATYRFNWHHRTPMDGKKFLVDV